MNFLLARIFRGRLRATLVAFLPPRPYYRSFARSQGRTFYRDDAGVFIEAGLEGELKPSVILEVLADETFALLMEIPALVPFVSANLDLLVCVDGVVYRLLALK